MDHVGRHEPRAARVWLELAPDGRSGALVGLAGPSALAVATAAFHDLAVALARTVLERRSADARALLARPLAGYDAARLALDLLAVRVGGAVELVDAAFLEVEDGFVGGYLHYERSVGVLVGARGAPARDGAQEFLRSLAMHVTALPPRWCAREHVPGAVLRELRDAVERSCRGEPEGVVEERFQRERRRLWRDTVLLEQPWVLDDALRVEEALARALGPAAKLVDFARLDLRH